MARWVLPTVLALICVAHPVAAQGARPIPPSLGPSGPATFKTNECVVTLSVEEGLRPSGQMLVLIDNRHRLTLRVLPRMSGGPASITFVPHAFLCDGGTHTVELTWRGGRETYKTIFPRPGALGLVPGNVFPKPIR
jgi:hypothetical protein